MKEIEKLVTQLPRGYSLDWTAESYQERAAGAQTPILYTLSLIVVFLCLAALYESWSIPTAILLAVPLGVIGAVVATALRGLERDIYFQVAMLTTIGLASKNAILIVEFAKEYVEAGKNVENFRRLGRPKRRHPGSTVETKFEQPGRSQHFQGFPQRCARDGESHAELPLRHASALQEVTPQDHIAKLCHQFIVEPRPLDWGRTPIDPRASARHNILAFQHPRHF